MGSGMKKKLAAVLMFMSLCGALGCSESDEDKDCQGNVRKCVDGVVFRCSSGHWKEMKQSCDLQAKTCIGGLRKCSGDVLMACKRGVWETDENCGESGKACDPDSVSCIPCSGDEKACFGNTIKQCREGAWEVLEKCEGDTPVCRSDTVQCQACEDGKYSCLGKALRKCEAGEWQMLKTCDEGVCDLETLSCRICKDGQKQCSGDVLQTCKSGEWADSEDCGTKGLQCDPVQLSCRDLTCDPGSRKCEKYKDSAFSYTCPDGFWQKERQCRFGTCAHNGKQCSDALCEIGERRCKKNDAGEDVLEECDGYDFQPIEVCDIKCSSYSTVPVPYCAECKFHSSICKDGAVSWCNLVDVWEKVKDCASGSCQDDTRCPEDECQYLDTKCVANGNGGRQYHCAPVDGVMKWKEGISCGGGCFSDGKNCQNCPPGERRCWDDRVVECRDNDWREVKTCDPGLCQNGACRVCSEGDWKCDIRTATAMVCENNNWKRTKCASGYCEDEYACLDATCALQDTLKCIGDTELRCSIDHKWVFKRRCVCVNGSCMD